MTKPAKNENIGDLLKSERTKRNISIRNLAREAGASPAIISRIEQGHTSPSFATLQKILSVFGLTFAEFFGSPQKEAASPVIKKSDIKLMAGFGQRLKVKLINAGRSEDLQLFYEEYEPNGHTGREMLVHQGAETGFCLKGKLQLELAGKKHTINQGDGWFFDPSLPHKFSNPFNQKALIMSANTPATY